MRVLIVKTTSMGDVVHALPAVTDMLRERPGLEVHWLVEAPFAAIPRLHPGVARVIPIAWRKWRKKLLQRDTWRAIGAVRRELREAPYDLVLDLQGLVKSALWGRFARGPLAGYDRESAREPLSSLFYARTARVSQALHAVDRCRLLAAIHLGYAPPASAPDFGIQPPAPSWPAPADYAVLIPNSSRADALWPEDRWIAVGQSMHERGWTPVVMWGSPAEQAMAERIAAGCHGVVPPFLSVQDTAAVLGRARAQVGLNTGFAHLGAAFGVPTVGVYCDHEPGLNGITGPGVTVSVGGRDQQPSIDAVLTATRQVLAGA